MKADAFLGYSANVFHRLVLLVLFTASLFAYAEGTNQQTRYWIKFPDQKSAERNIFEVEEHHVTRSHHTISSPDRVTETNFLAIVHFRGSIRIINLNTNTRTASMDITVDRLETCVNGITNRWLNGGVAIKANCLSGEWFFKSENGTISLGAQRTLASLIRFDSPREHFHDPSNHVYGLDVPRAVGEEWSIEDRSAKAFLLRLLKGFPEDLPPEEVHLGAQFVSITNVAGIDCYQVRMVVELESRVWPKRLNLPKYVEWKNQSVTMRATIDHFVPCDGVTQLQPEDTFFEAKAKVNGEGPKGKVTTSATVSIEDSELWRMRPATELH